MPPKYGNRGSQKGVIFDPLFWSFLAILGSDLTPFWQKWHFDHFWSKKGHPPMESSVIEWLIWGTMQVWKWPQKVVFWPHFGPPSKVPFLGTFLMPFLTHARMYSLVNLSIKWSFFTNTDFRGVQKMTLFGSFLSRSQIPYFTFLEGSPILVIFCIFCIFD